MKLSAFQTILSLMIVLMLVQTTYESRSKSKLYLSNKIRLYHKNLNQKGAPAADPAKKSDVSATLESTKEGNVTTTSYLTNNGNPNIKGVFLEKDMAKCEAQTKIKYCRDTMCAPCKRIIDMEDYFNQTECYLTTNMYTGNVYTTKDAGSLYMSEDLTLSTMPVKIGGAPQCFTMESPRENKTMHICLKDEAQNDQFIQAMFQFMRCRNGDNLQNGLPLNETCALLYGDKVFGMSGTAEEMANQASKDAEQRNKNMMNGGTNTMSLQV